MSLDCSRSSLRIERPAWRRHIGEPNGKRGAGVVPPIPTAATVLDEHLAAANIQHFVFETPNGEPRALDYVVREAIRPTLPEAGIPWYGLHAFRRGLATNLHELGVADGIADVVIQAILRHTNVSVTRAAYIKNDAVDPRSLAATEALESAVCNQHATGATEAESRTDVKP
jgi:integrase